MAFTSGHMARCWFAGISLAAYTRQTDAGVTVPMHDVTVFTSGAKEFVPGQESGRFSASGPLDTANAQTLAAGGAKSLNASAVALPVSFFPNGTASASAVLASTNHTNFTTTTGVDGPAEWSIESLPTAKIDINGSLFDTSTVTTTTDGSTVDNGAASSNGAVFHLHVTAYSGLTSDTITIEGSTSGAFGGEETTVATFAAVTSVLMALGGASLRVEVTGTVPRYLRAVDTIVGTGSCTRTIAYARR